jgi:hypothetical protein
LKARGVRYMVWVHLARMRVPADQGSVRYSSTRGLDSGSSSCEHMTAKERDSAERKESIGLGTLGTNSLREVNFLWIGRNQTDFDQY